MRVLGTCIGIALSLAILAPVQGRAAGDDWTYSVMPYLWFPGVDGTIRYGTAATGVGSLNVSIDAEDLLKKLDFAFMLAGQARKGRWLVATDIMYLDLSNKSSKVRSVDFDFGSGPLNIATGQLDAGSKTSLEGWIWTLVGGYAAVTDTRASLDLLAGFRYLNIETSTDWQLGATVTGTGPLGQTATVARTGSVSTSEDLWAGIVGAKGRVRLGASDWFIDYYADVGGGSDLFTWQGAAGIGAEFHWGEVTLDYRYLYFEQSGGKPIKDLSFSGPALGVIFRF